MANQPSVHPFHDIAKPGDTINWRWSEDDFEGHTLAVGYDGQLGWGYGAHYRESATKDYLEDRRSILYAGLAGRLPLKEVRQELAQLDEDFAEERAWGWGDATPALDEYAREYPFR